MKKNLLFLAAAAVALASCSSDETTEVNQGEAISFRPLVNNVTRAADIEQTTLSSFVVNAKVAGGATSFFDNETFSNGGSGTTYSSSTKHYWPSTGNLDFYAYAPAGNAQVTYTDYKTFEVEPSSTVSSQVDFIYAATKGKNKASNASGVELNFRHTGSKIICKVKNSSTSMKFAVEGWKVGYLDTKGKFIFADSNTDGNNTGTGTVLSAGQWSENTTQSVDNQYSSTFSTVNIAAKVVAPLDEHVTTLDGEMILVPQVINAATEYANAGSPAAGDKLNGTFIAVKLKILNAENDAVIAADGSNTFWAIWPIGGSAGSFAWAPGMKYIYTIDLAGGGYYELNQGSSDENLDAVLADAEIKFVDVTVDAWDTTPGNTSVEN